MVDGRAALEASKNFEGAALPEGPTGMQVSLLAGWGSGVLAVGGLVGSLLLASGCEGEEEGPFLQSELYLTEGDEEEQYQGGSCMAVARGQGMAGSTVPGATSSDAAGNLPIKYFYNYEGRGEGVRFIFVDNVGSRLEQRNYDAAFIASGRRDELTVEVGGDTLRFVNWGVQQCEPIREPDRGP